MVKAYGNDSIYEAVAKYLQYIKKKGPRYEIVKGNVTWEHLIRQRREAYNCKSKEIKEIMAGMRRSELLKE